MRAALSILGLVIAFAIVMFMMKKQAEQLVPRAVQAASAASAAKAADAARTQPDAVRQQVQGALEQAASKASDAQP